MPFDENHLSNVVEFCAKKMIEREILLLKAEQIRLQVSCCIGSEFFLNTNKQKTHHVISKHYEKYEILKIFFEQNYKICFKEDFNPDEIEDHNPFLVIRQETEEEIARLKSLSYEDYLKTKHWKSVRSKIVDLAGRRCQLCNAGGLLNVHHRTYKNIGEERFEDLIALCPPCHQKHHGIEGGKGGGK